VQESIIWVKISFQYSTTNPLFKADDFGSKLPTGLFANNNGVQSKPHFKALLFYNLVQFS